MVGLHRVEVWATAGAMVLAKAASQSADVEYRMLYVEGGFEFN